MNGESYLPTENRFNNLFYLYFLGYNGCLIVNFQGYKGYIYLYLQGDKCEWRILATHGEKIVLNITTLDIPSSHNCNENYLEVSILFVCFVFIINKMVLVLMMLIYILSVGSRAVDGKRYLESNASSILETLPNLK